MRIEFLNRKEAIDWISSQAMNDAHSEVLLMELNFNFVCAGYFYLETLEASFALAS